MRITCVCSQLERASPSVGQVLDSLPAASDERCQRGQGEEALVSHRGQFRRIAADGCTAFYIGDDAIDGIIAVINNEPLDGGRDGATCFGNVEAAARVVLCIAVFGNPIVQIAQSAKVVQEARCVHVAILAAGLVLQREAVAGGIGADNPCQRRTVLHDGVKASRQRSIIATPVLQGLSFAATTVVDLEAVVLVADEGPAVVVVARVVAALQGMSAIGRTGTAFRLTCRGPLVGSCS